MCIPRLALTALTFTPPWPALTSITAPCAQDAWLVIDATAYQRRYVEAATHVRIPLDVLDYPFHLARVLYEIHELPALQFELGRMKQAGEALKGMRELCPV